jgi:phenylacetate-CoA ligase
MIWNATMEKAGRAEIRELQLTRLRQVVDRTYHNVPAYRAKLTAAGVKPDDIRSLADITKLPFTTKQDMREAYPYGLLAVPMKQVVRVHCSSGTTGKPTVVAYTRNDLAVWAEVLARTLVAGGLSDTSVFQVAVNYGLFTGGLGFHYAAELIGASVVPISGGNTARQVMLMKDFGTTAMIITPSYALHVAETMREMGVKPSDTALQSIFCGAETWSDRMHDQIEETYGVKAYDVYGLSEIIGPGVSCECSAHDGLHIQEDHFYIEIIDPESGEVLPEGAKGEVVITTLTKEGMPMIRYRTRDLSALRQDRCACGRTQTRMDRVVGRSDDMLIIRGVNVFPSQVEDVLLGLGETAPHYQLVVERESALDTLTVMVEKAEGMDVASDTVQSAERRIQERLKAATGLSPRVRLVPPKTIERSEGKAKRVIDRRAM